MKFAVIHRYKNEVKMTIHVRLNDDGSVVTNILFEKTGNVPIFWIDDVLSAMCMYHMSQELIQRELKSFHQNKKQGRK